MALSVSPTDSIWQAESFSQFALSSWSFSLVRFVGIRQPDGKICIFLKILDKEKIVSKIRGLLVNPSRFLVEEPKSVRNERLCFHGRNAAPP